MAAHGQFHRIGNHVAETSEAFMPWWPMAMPSVTVMVQNSRGVPFARGHALLDHLRLAHQRNVAGSSFVPAADATPTSGCPISSLDSPIAYRNERCGARAGPTVV
jgi:hypothetical protein